MDITEKERLMLVGKKEEICGITKQILEMAHDPKNSLEIKKNMTTILSLLSTIASYSEVKNYKFDGFREIADNDFVNLNMPLEYLEELKKKDPIRWNNDIVFSLELFCNYANSVRFDFTKKRVKIILPKITLPKNLNIGNITNQT